MENILSILTKDEKEFISRHGIAPSDIYDGRGEIIKVYHDNAKKSGCSFVLANPCPYGHRLKDRSGHCIICRPFGIRDTPDPRACHRRQRAGRERSAADPRREAADDPEERIAGAGRSQVE